MILTEEQLFDYIACPVHYDTVHNKGFAPHDRESMARLLTKVANAFYLNLMNGKVLPTSTLKKKWDSICETHKDYVTQQRCLEGMGQLMKLYQWAENEGLLIVDMNIPYQMAINGPHGVVDFKGEIGVLATNKTGQMELLVTDFSNRYPDQAMLDMKLKFSLDSYALNKVYNKSIGIRIHNVKNNKDFYSYRIKDDYVRLENTISNVAFCIENNIIYPRESILCSSCSMVNFCKVWQMNDERR